jgi:hypothetical protein
MVDNTKEAPEPIWVPISARMPKDGQSVLVKGRHTDAPRRVTFRGQPVARWEEGSIVYQFEYFTHWAAV